MSERSHLRVIVALDVLASLRVSPPLTPESIVLLEGLGKYVVDGRARVVGHCTVQLARKHVGFFIARFPIPRHHSHGMIGREARANFYRVGSGGTCIEEDTVEA